MSRYVLVIIIAILPTLLAKLAHAEETTPTALFQLYTGDAEPVISKALAEQGAGEKVAATIAGHLATEPLFSTNDPIEVEVHGLRFDDKTKRWNASLVAASETMVVTAIPISGRYEEVMSLPVLRRQLRSGDTIGEDDVEMQDFAVPRIRGEVITNSKDLIGQTPVRTLSSSRPIRTHEVSGPILVRKDSVVTVRYEVPGMEITSTGIALEEGSKGKLIAIRNPDSKKTIHGVITGENTISIPTRRVNGNVQASSQEGITHATN